MTATKPKTKPKTKKPDPFRTAKSGDVVILKLAKGKTAPKPPDGVNVWTLDGDSLLLTPADLFARGWIRRKA